MCAQVLYEFALVIKQLCIFMLPRGHVPSFWRLLQGSMLLLLRYVAMQVMQNADVSLEQNLL